MWILDGKNRDISAGVYSWTLSPIYTMISSEFQDLISEVSLEVARAAESVVSTI